MDYTHTLVSEFSSQLASTQKGIRQMTSWYIFSDKRPGSIIMRFEDDAKMYFEYEKMFQGQIPPRTGQGGTRC